VLAVTLPLQDDGCDVAVSCLACPLAQCRYDNPAFYQASLLQTRDAQVLEIQRREGLKPGALATRTGLGVRTIHRILARARETT
jgi:hypothetical protein